MLPNFYQRLENSKWICFTVETYKENEQWVTEFYGNLMKTDMSQDHNIEAFKAKDCKSGTWIASKLCMGKSVPWATTKVIILCSDLMAKARI
ncbi:hypothetical protein RDI58_022446 [Solanum bulbocastanum]|uniref:Uncharacterized protein n=1 Tax=Solanum bulbocastanum TaxID=147425 RepID=A0AAN8T7P5_SOLBU